MFFVNFELYVLMSGNLLPDNGLRMQMKKYIRKLELSDTTVYIWEDIQKVSLDEVMRLFGILPEWRQNKVLGINNRSVRKESVLSFALLQVALETEFGIKDKLDVDYLEHGKPVLRHHHGVQFNLSHCREAVACAVGRHDVGIDVERRGRYNAILAQHVLSRNELRKMQNAPDVDLAFTSLWTKKEALLKMTGDGVGSNMNNVLDRPARYNASTFVAANYVCSVAVRKENPVNVFTGQ